MAIINAANNGNWSSAATWPGSVFPTSADDVYANNKTIFIDQNITVNSLNTTQGTGGVAGGRFYANQGDLIINSKTITAGSTYCVTVTGTGTRTISADNIRASDTTNTTAAVLIQGTTTALPNVITYGNAIGGTAGGGGATSHPAGITVDGGMLTHYGFISGGAVNNRSSGLKIYQTASSTIPVSAIVYGNIKGGTLSTCTGIISEFSPAANILSACLITIYGNVSGGDALFSSTTNNNGLYTTSTIRTVVSGNVHGGAGNGVSIAGIQAAGTTVLDLNIIGNIYSNNNSGTAPGLYYLSTAGNINIIGDIVSLDPFIPSIGGANYGAAGLYQNGGTTLNVLGNVYGAKGTRNYGGAGIYLDATCTVNITGNVYGGTTGWAYGIVIADSPNIVNIYGNVYGGEGPATDCHGVYHNIATARLNIFGSAIAGEGVGNYAVRNVAAGTVYAKRVVANSFGIGSAQTAYNPGYAVLSNSISGICLVEEMVFGQRGQIPVFGPTYIVSTSTNSITGRKLLPTAAIIDQPIDVFVNSTIANTLVPDVSNVILGTSYNNNTLTGTMVVPQASSVSFDIPVGSTKGTAYLSPSAFWNTQTTELTSLSTVIGYRLNNAATTEFIGNTLAAYNI